jgi:dynein heavy chain 2, cytosolic
MLDVYDDIWRQNEHDEYSEQRMRHLLAITSNAFVQSIQKQLSNIDLWSDGKDSARNREHLRNAVNICERWSCAVEQLTGLYWRACPSHPWKGDSFQATHVVQFKRRLQEIVSIRSSYDQVLRLDTSIDKNDFSPTKIFGVFANINPIQFNAYTDPEWKAAINEYERVTSDIHRRAAKQLRKHFHEIHDDHQRLLAEFKLYKNLIERESVRNELVAERESLVRLFEKQIETLVGQAKQLTRRTPASNGRDTHPTGIVFALETSRQIQTKVDQRSNMSTDKRRARRCYRSNR